MVFSDNFQKNTKLPAFFEPLSSESLLDMDTDPGSHVTYAIPEGRTTASWRVFYEKGPETHLLPALNKL